MDIRLEHKLSLQQVLTPQLIETMRLLQLPIIELTDRLNEELLSNPMLEIASQKVSDKREASPSEQSEQLAEYDKLYDGLSRMSTHIRHRPDSDEEFSPLDIVPYKKSIYDFLTEQLAMLTSDTRLIAIGNFLLGNLDERGFLAVSLDELKQEISLQGVVNNPTSEEMEKALELVQLLEPSGIGARDLRESYLIQLGDLGQEGSLAYRMVRDYFDMLSSKNVVELASLAEVSPDDMEKALDEIAHLDKSPGMDYSFGDEFSDTSKNSTFLIKPDIVVERFDGDFRIIYNESDIPSLMVNHRYLNLLKKAKTLSPETKEFLLKKLDSAKWWVDALELRRRNLIAVTESIVQHQKEFFKHGPSYIQPLMMTSIAKEIGIHPATVSRIVKGKFVETPHGIFPMRSFFGRATTTKGGEDIAALKIKEHLVQFIKSEDKRKPLSDQKLSELLREKGIEIARRTVAKYREQLNIPRARMRRTE